MQEIDSVGVGEVTVALLAGSGSGFSVRRGATRFDYYWDKLEELNGNGSLAQLLPDIARMDGEWSTFTPSVVGGIECQAAEFVASVSPELRDVNIVQTGSGNINLTFGNDVIVRCKIAIFTQPGTLALPGGNSVSVMVGQVRVAFSIDEWVFAGTSNCLYLGVRIESQGGVQPQTVGIRQQPDTNLNILLMGPAAVLLPRVSEQQRTVGMYPYDSSRKCMEWAFRAPNIGAAPVTYAILIDTVSTLATAFNQSLISLTPLPGRPPTTTHGTSTSSQSSTAGTIIGVVLLLLIFGGIIALALYWYLRQRARNDEEDEDSDDDTSKETAAVTPATKASTPSKIPTPAPTPAPAPSTSSTRK